MIQAHDFQAGFEHSVPGHQSSPIHWHPIDEVTFVRWINTISLQLQAWKTDYLFLKMQDADAPERKALKDIYVVVIKATLKKVVQQDISFLNIQYTDSGCSEQEN